MKPIRSILAATLLIGTLAACDAMDHCNDPKHHHKASANDVYFSGVHGDSKTFCGPGQRARRVCY